MSEMLALLYLGTVGFWVYFHYTTKNQVMKMSTFFMIYVHMLGGLVLAQLYSETSTLTDLTDTFRLMYVLNGYALLIIIMVVMIVNTERGVDLLRSLERKFGGGKFGKKEG